MECPISGEPCSKACAWNIDGECVMTKISYSLMIVTKELADRRKNGKGR